MTIILFKLKNTCVELNIGNISQLVPHPSKSDIRRGQVQPDDLGLREDPGVGEGGEARAGAEIEDPLGLLVIMQHPDPVLYLGLVQKVELGLAQERYSDCVTVEISPG